jgi:hypothetical protein
MSQTTLTVIMLASLLALPIALSIGWLVEWLQKRSERIKQ